MMYLQKKNAAVTTVHSKSGQFYRGPISTIPPLSFVVPGRFNPDCRGTFPMAQLSARSAQHTKEMHTRNFREVSVWEKSHSPLGTPASHLEPTNRTRNNCQKISKHSFSITATPSSAPFTTGLDNGVTADEALLSLRGRRSLRQG